MTMKITELRLGNWWDNKEGGQYIIDNSTMIDFLNEASENNGEIDLDPILLTEQWLKDFGFKEDRDFGNWHLEQYKIYSKDGNNIGFYENEFCWYFPCGDDFYSWIKNLKHVHQLQNLYFALTDEELTKS